ncbi:MlaA family lipoprotein, partial [Pseudomonas aeruginosa]
MLPATGGLGVDYVGEDQGNDLNVLQAIGDPPEITALRVVDRRYNTSFRYGQVNSPFEYEKLRYIYTEARKLQIAD